jgi:hypothetical protein
VFASGTDLVALIDQAGRWLEAGGGEWPAPAPDARDSRRKGRPKGTKEAIMETAEQAIQAGMGPISDSAALSII